MTEKDTYRVIIEILDEVLPPDHQGLVFLREQYYLSEPRNDFWNALQYEVFTSSSTLPPKVGRKVCAYFFDYLSHLHETAPPDLTAKLENYYTLMLLYHDKEATLEKIHSLLQLYREAHRPQIFASILVFLGSHHIDNSESEIGLACLKEAKLIAEEHNLHLYACEICITLANYYFAQGEYGLSYEQYLSALVITQKNPQMRSAPKVELLVLQNMAIIHIELEQNDLAFERLTQVEELSRQKQLWASYIPANINKCVIARRNKDVKLLKECIQKIENLLHEYHFPNDKIRAAYINKLGELAYLENNFEKALEHFHEALELAQHSQSVKAIGQNHCAIAETYLANYKLTPTANTLELVLKHLVLAEKAIKSMPQSKMLPPVYRLYADYYQAIGDYEKAFNNYKKYDEKSRAVNSLIVQERSRIHDVTKSLNIVKREKEIVEEKNRELEEAHVKLLQQQEQLEQQTHEIEFINEELTERNKALEHLNTQKDNFLRVAAHDLKNPLSSIILNVENLRRYKNKMSEEKFEQQLERIGRTSQRMFKIIESLLLYNKVENNSTVISPRDFDISETFSQLLSETSAKTTKKDIAVALICPSNLMMYSDEQLLFQIIDNLLSNAIKFSPPSSDVSIVVEYLADEDKVAITITDSGPGFSPDDREKLFQPFTQLSAKPTAGEHSSGLGLAIVFHLVKILGGSIELLETDRGASFRLTFPRSYSSQNT